MAFSVVPETTCVNIMPNKEDEFLAGLDKEIEINDQQDLGEDLFPEETKEEVKDKKEEEKPLPFYKDPKVQKYIEKQVEKRFKDIKPTAQESFKQEVASGDPDLIKAFEAIIGNDTPEKIAALKALERSLASSDERASKKAMEQFEKIQQEQSEKEVREMEEAQEEIEEGFENIEDHYGIELNDKQKEAFKDFLIKIEPRGGYQEYPDFVETFEVFKNYIKANRPSNAQNKVLASRVCNSPRKQLIQIKVLSRTMELKHCGKSLQK